MWPVRRVHNPRVVLSAVPLHAERLACAVYGMVVTWLRWEAYPRTGAGLGLSCCRDNETRQGQIGGHPARLGGGLPARRLPAARAPRLAVHCAAPGRPGSPAVSPPIISARTQYLSALLGPQTAPV